MEKFEKDQFSVICPYDKSHIIHKSRIQKHLMKCSKNYPPNYFETCPFNATHLMFKSELAHHIEECPDRKYISATRYGIELKNHGSLKSCPPSQAESCLDIYSDVWNDAKTQYNDFSSDASVVSDSSSLVLPHIEKIQRKPFGYSQTMMIDVNEESHAEDVESITNSMGRGKFFHNLCKERKDFRHVGKNRKYIHDEVMKVGTSAATDVEDLESLSDSIDCDA